jgi:ATP-binding cassette subfamily B protein
LLNNSQIISKTTNSLHQVVNESIGGIRDVILGGYQKYFENRYVEQDKLSRNALASNYILSTTPRFLLEGLAIGIVCLIVIFSNSHPSSLIVTFGVLAMAAQRGLPALNIINNSISNIKGNNSIIEDVLDLLELNESRASNSLDFEFNQKIEFKNVFFKYNLKGEGFNLNDISLVINKGANVGIVGTSGSGKSTFTDLLTGLLRPTNGEILIDSDTLSIEKHKIWQCKIGYVPQSIFLIDGSFIENIAFGVEKELIDLEKINYVSKTVGLDTYIKTLPKQYNSLTGERGISLSGGQVQRIGIARALYKNPEILVLDEATSSLDMESEKTIIDLINSGSEKTTIIMIAHRISTLQYCDILYEFNNSKLIGSFSYKQYINKLN